MEINFKISGLNWFKRSVKKVTSINNPAEWLLQQIGSKSSSGVKVNTKNALKLETVYSCIRLISETIGSLPLELYQKTDKGKEKLTDHPLYDLVHTRPNRIMNSGIYQSLQQAKLLTHGNSYALVVNGPNDKPDELRYLDPDFVNPVLVNNTVYYNIKPHNGVIQQTVHSDYIIHLRGFGVDLLKGLSPIAVLSDTIGTEMAAKNYQGKFYKNGSFFRGLISIDGKLAEGRNKELSKEFDTIYGGPDNMFQTAVLHGGAKYTPINLPQKDAQFIETTYLGVEALARAYSVPLPLLQHLHDVNNSITENLDIQFVKYCIRGWVKKWEEEYNSKLLTRKERGQKYYFKINVDALLRGDIVKRMKMYDSLFYKGALNADEIRALENMNSLPDKLGQKYFNAVNLHDHETIELQKEILKEKLKEVN